MNSGKGDGRMFGGTCSQLTSWRMFYVCPPPGCFEVGESSQTFLMHKYLWWAFKSIPLYSSNPFSFLPRAQRYCSDAFFSLEVTVERSKSELIMTHGSLPSLAPFTPATPQILIFCTGGDWIDGSIEHSMYLCRPCTVCVIQHLHSTVYRVATFSYTGLLSMKCSEGGL